VLTERGRGGEIMPKKSKKGGGGKTEEERLLYLQQRAQAEEEMAKKKEEILTLFLKDKLQKEEKNTAVNLLKLNEGWRSILRQTRAAELRRDIGVLSQTFERHLDGLDSIIKNLESDLQEAERQSARVRRIHLQHLERLWAQQDRRLALVQQQWEDDLKLLSSTLSAERTHMLDHCQQQRAGLEDAAFTMELQYKEVMDEVYRLYDENMAAYQGTHTSTKADLMLKDQDRLKDQILQNQETKQKRNQLQEQLDIVLAKDQRIACLIQTQTKMMEKLQDTVNNLRELTNSTATGNQPVDKDLIATKNQVNQKAHELRDQLTQIHSAGKKQLSDLTVQGDNAAKKLRAVIAKGERVLRVAAMCHKLESEQKIVCLPLFSAEEPKQERPETETPAKEVAELRQVMKRINVGVLQREALKRKKDDLSRENQQLKLLLRQHLDAMTVSDRTLDGRHALLTVYQAPTSTGPPESGRRHNVIEAVHAVKHSV
ncbi:hypothetical protein L3Q82_026200, partial [Scortum barcoo]